MTAGELRPVWRSMLFVPAHVDKFVARAHERGADAIVLDLEDAVPAAQKATARAQIAAVAARIGAAGTTVLVRINAVDTLRDDDIRGVVNRHVQALVVPKASTPEVVRAVADAVDAAERQQGLPLGHTGLLLQIEDVHALPRLDDIATASSRVLGLSLGSEDFSASAGIAPVPQALLLPNQLVQFACARAGVLAFGFAASIADYADIEAFAGHARLARQLGFVGALCVHPSQVAVLNAAFAPSADEIEEARELVLAFELAQRAGRGAIEFRGRMVDPPVVARAQALLRRAP